MPRHYQDLIQTYLDFTSGHESTDRVRKWSFISVLAGCLERRVYMDRGFYKLFPNLYVFIIGKSGLIKKSTSTAIAVDLLREMPKICMMSERLTSASLIQQLHNSTKYYHCNGVKMRQSALFAYASELAVFMDGLFSGITELLTGFYDCQPNDSTKPWVHATKAGGPMPIYGPCLNILGASTSSWLEKCIPKTEMEGGFTSRIIFVVENNVPQTLVAWPEMPTEGNVRDKILSDMAEIYQLTGVFLVEHSARAFFTQWYENHVRENVAKNDDNRMTGYLSRKGDTALKLAMVRSVSQCNSLVVKTEHIEWGLAELDALERDMKDAFSGLASVPSSTFEIKKYMESRGEVPKAELEALFCQRMPVSKVMSAIDELIAMDFLAALPSVGASPAKYVYTG